MSQITKEPKDVKDAKGGGKPRVFALAAELNLDTKTVLEFCKELGFSSIKNQLNALEQDQVDAIKERVKKGPKATTATPITPTPAARPTLPQKIDDKVRTLPKAKAPAAKAPASAPAPAPAAPVETVTTTPAEVQTTPVPAPETPPAVAAADEPSAPADAAEVSADSVPAPKAAEDLPPVAPNPPVGTPANLPPSMPTNRVPNLNSGGRPPVINQTRPPVIGTSRPPQILPPRPTPPAPTGGPRPTGGSGHPPPRPPAPNPAGGSGPVRSGPSPYGPPRPGGSAGRPGGHPPPTPGAPRPGGGPPVPGRPPVKPPAPGQKSVKLTSEQIQRLRELEKQRGNQKLSIQDVQRHVVATPTDPAKPGGPAPGAPAGRPARPARDDDEDRKGGPGAKKGVGEVAGRDARHKARQDKGRQRGPSTDRGSIIIGAGGRVDTIEERFGSRIKKHRGKQHVHVVRGPISGKVEIALPITVRSLSEATGVKGGELLLKLKQLTNALYTINTAVEFEVAELICSEKGIELVAKKQETAEDKTLRELDEARKKRAGEEHLVPRPPIVTIMGHVDHGKTSLLDKIRQQYGLSSDVVSTETGGITQVLRAWRVEKDGRSTTFLDTPGHEAFTKMRARGANVTDIAVIVVSAADGIMPQTQEAVSHAKAADVDIIVAINKCDLPGANPDKVKNQLYSLELVPEDMGGDVPVLYTSAVTGQGIGELLDAVALLAELAELKADPDLSASGTCLEAYLDPEEGVQATLLVQQGTLNRGDVLLCGATFGRVRAMYDDMGKPIASAGPSTPVRITGLDEVPDADDLFYAVPAVSTAREIAGQRKDRKQEAALHKFTPVSLDKLKEQHAKGKISELKVILKAEARGSVEAIKKELEKLTHDEVRTRVLHAGIGAITESDVQLALTSPEDTLLVGFNVTADDPALRLAEQRGITDKIREYQIIYNLVDDIKAALEGRLKPVEEVVHLGRAVIRQTFKVGKVGTIAGCYVTSGTIERNARVRVIREGVVVYPAADKQVGLDSLKRFKDDAKEVREGFECGMKIAGFDDIKVGDVIEAFKIEIKQRTL